jgi:hypothetical protein
MKRSIGWVLLGTLVLRCGKETEQNGAGTSPTPVEGTWKLVRGTVIEKGDTTVTDYTKD